MAEGETEDAKRVLLLASHVVHGCVGNRATTLPVQLLTRRAVDVVNACEFSNHLAYPGGATGRRATGEDFDAQVEGLSKNGLVAEAYVGVLTGYMGNASWAAAARSFIVDTVLPANPDALWLVDPVLGDHGKLYVDPEMVATYRDQIFPHADAITPNQTEATLLTGLPCDSLAHVHAVLDALHAMGPNVVVISSLDDGIGALADALAADLGNPEEVLPCVCSVAGENPHRFVVVFPRIEGTFSGTGDVFSAFLLSWYFRLGSWEDAVCQALAGMQIILAATPPGQELRLAQTCHLWASEALGDLVSLPLPAPP